MPFVFEEEREPESPFIQMIWRTQSDQPGNFMSQAVVNSELVIVQYAGRTLIALRGPETKATVAEFPAEAHFFGIQFRLGTFMPHLPTSQLVDRAIELPKANRRTFWLHGSAWEVPTYDTADVFVDRLVRAGLLRHEPLVEAALTGEAALSPRSVQRRFLQATGVTQATVNQIERARRAAALLRRGVPILDTVELAGYADQPHLTRSLKRFIGHTPAQLLATPSTRISGAGQGQFGRITAKWRIR